MSERWFGPAEMAQRLGVSPKALRVYEREGLVKPVRSSANWRAYGPDQQARLHQVLALKRLGLPLKRIGELLAGRLASLDAVLALQEQALRVRRADVEAGLALLSAARKKLARDGALSPDDLTQLTRETVMTEKLSEQEMAAVFQPLADKHFTPAEQAALTQDREGEVDHARYPREWEVLIAEAKALQAKGDPTTPEARDLARRWFAQVNLFTRGDTAATQKVGAMWKEAMADPAVAPRLPFSADLMAFVGAAAKAGQA